MWVSRPAVTAVAAATAPVASPNRMPANSTAMIPTTSTAVAG